MNHPKADRRILILCPLGYVAALSFVMDSIHAFAERGYLVDVLVSSSCDPPFDWGHEKVRIHTFKDRKANRGMKYVSLFREAHLLAKSTTYDLVIGLSQMGLIVAWWLKKRFGVPCIYYNDELWFGDERASLLGKAYGYTMKFLERAANRQVLFTVTQDPERGRFLAGINRIPTETMRYLPNSRTGQARVRRTSYLYEMFGFPKEVSIVLWMGAVSPNDGALELAREARDWPSDFRMVFHFRTEHPSPYMREIMECHGKGQTFISDRLVSYDEVDDLVASAAIGLGIYADKGINARYICSSSGKINAFLQAGAPCIVKNFEGLRWVEDAGAGICVDHTSGILEAAKRIREDYQTYQQKSIEVFERRLSFDRAFASIAEEIEKLLERDEARGRKRVASIQDVVDRGLCISCGACAAVSRPGTVEMRYDKGRGMYSPHIRSPELLDGSGREFSVCPGKGYPIISLSESLHPDCSNRSTTLGSWQEAWAARSTDPEIVEQASSGGVMTALAEYLITTGEADGAVVTGLEYGHLGPRPRSYIARSRSELIDAQGSKYCPSPSLLSLAEVMKTPGRFVYIGTPCQIAGLRMIQELIPEARQKIPFVIGNFCGGFRDCRETDTLIRREGFLPWEIRRFRYRGGGQPGSMLMQSESGRSSQLPYPQYARRTGYIKHRRCRLCVDATAELADISCGDAWLERFHMTGFPWSIVIARSGKATRIIRNMVQKNLLLTGDITADEIEKAQGDNMHSKKIRQAARRRLFCHLGLALPEYDGGFIPDERGLLFEAKVFLTGNALYSLEKLGLYPVLARMLGRY